MKNTVTLEMLIKFLFFFDIFRVCHVSIDYSAKPVSSVGPYMSN